MHITKKLAAAHEEGRATYSFEFSPPKTAQGVQNLYDLIDRMHDYGPSFIDITWGAGGRHSNLTCEMIRVAQTAYGLETCMHLTCTDMGRDKIDQALQNAYNAGCTNILALRGDPPREQETWTAVEDGFRYARDLVARLQGREGGVCVNDADRTRRQRKKNLQGKPKSMVMQTKPEITQTKSLARSGSRKWTIGIRRQISRVV